MSVEILAGWALAAAFAAALLRARRRCALAALAEHEIRGAAAALSLAATAAARRGTALPVPVVEGQLERLFAGISDLGAARGAPPDGRLLESVPVERAAREASAAWALAARASGRRVHVEATAPAGPVARGPASKALGNLIANSLEHGRGDVMVRVRGGARARVEVADDGPGPPSRPLSRLPGGSAVRPGRGLGLGIAARAARSAGGRLWIEDGHAHMDLPRGER